jgi:hypothetical protein
MFSQFISSCNLILRQRRSYGLLVSPGERERERERERKREREKERERERERERQRRTERETFNRKYP